MKYHLSIFSQELTIPQNQRFPVFGRALEAH
jgi:hypothetical protein